MTKRVLCTPVPAFAAVRLNLFSRLQSISLRLDSVCLGACANGFVQHANWRQATGLSRTFTSIHGCTLLQAVHLGVLLMRVVPISVYAALC